MVAMPLQLGTVSTKGTPWVSVTPFMVAMPLQLGTVSTNPMAEREEQVALISRNALTTRDSFNLED